jgi:dTDP-4-dehydrorhamnose 3,5-epimerase
MILEPTPLAGAVVITPEPATDERGEFARLFCAETFAANGLDPHLDQISYSFNRRKGTLRGLHLQRPPHGEAKLVRVTAGAIFDVIVDVRVGSAGFGRWFGLELNATERRQLYIPIGFAHGFQTLTDAAEVVYAISTPYVPASQDGLRWDDPALAIDWPDPVGAVLSNRDKGLCLLKDFESVVA